MIYVPLMSQTKVSFTMENFLIVIYLLSAKLGNDPRRRLKYANILNMMCQH